MTLRLYHDDPYTTRFTANVLERFEWEDSPALVLDRPLPVVPDLPGGIPLGSLQQEVRGSLPIVFQEGRIFHRGSPKHLPTGRLLGPRPIVKVVAQPDPVADPQVRSPFQCGCCGYFVGPHIHGAVQDASVSVPIRIG